ncbi:hypothetical protein RBSH_00697 [Rhodopirellula baltica SH28]|uniref:Uncharacterized protein n=1 Tax=Rhodopirellula baltica SH28 TaxID=993517 RepID=K5EDJ4_RHOBT|nr:hypothetical protein RBSH_00697 [Rhodopirellula baltica SH28]
MLNEWQYTNQEREVAAVVGVVVTPINVRPTLMLRKLVISGVIVVQSKAHLLEVVTTTHTSRGLAGGLNSRQQEPYEYSNDRDNDQEFDKGEPLSSLIAFHKPKILEKKEKLRGRSRTESFKRQQNTIREVTEGHLHKRKNDRTDKYAALSNWPFQKNSFAPGPDERSNPKTELIAVLFLKLFFHLRVIVRLRLLLIFRHRRNLRWVILGFPTRSTTDHRDASKRQKQTERKASVHIVRPNRGDNRPPKKNERSQSHKRETGLDAVVNRMVR